MASATAAPAIPRVERATAAVGGTHRRSALGRLLRDPRAVASAVIIALFVVAAIGAGAMAPYNPISVDLSHALQPPDSNHWLGTDELGRDLLTRIIYGARMSLFIGGFSVAVASVGGLLLGTVAGYAGGMVDLIVMRVGDIVLTFPNILFAILLIAVVGPGIPNLIVSIGVLSIPAYSRVVRASVLTLKEKDFVEAARALGASAPWIVWFHILPNALAPILVHSTFLMSFSILVAAGLSFLGIGVPPPTPEWGAMLASGRDYIALAPHVILAPGLALVVLTIAINLLGDGLHDALEPRLLGSEGTS